MRRMSPGASVCRAARARSHAPRTAPDPGPAGRVCPQDHLPAARMRSRRGATRGDTHEAREVADGLEPALHLTTGWTRQATATRCGSRQPNPDRARHAPGVRVGTREQHKRTQTRRTLPRAGAAHADKARTQPRVARHTHISEGCLLFRGASVARNVLY